jgi:hypothetical protein
MSQNQFDGLTRSLASATSRGKMLKALAGGALAAAAGTLLSGRAAEAAVGKECCVYYCPTTNRYSAECLNMPTAPCAKTQNDCTLVDEYGVTKCSVCGAF